ncbi:MAG: zinc-ribbon domain-containing protein [Nitrospinae bacterium]|nr:zinc-ribbon domain-containing protein [Nitrospinota bacterium]
MDISCPHCQATYNVDVPNLDDEGEIDFKCVKCENVFTIHSNDPDFGKDSGNNDANTDTSDGISSPMDDLDAFLDDLIEKEIREDRTTGYSPTDASKDNVEDSGEFESEDLSKDQKDESPPSMKIEEPEELHHEAEDIWAEIDKDQEEQETPAEKAETVHVVDSVDQELEDIWAEADQDQEEQQTPAVEAETADVVEDPVAKKEEEDLWAKAFSEQEAREAQDIEKTRVAETFTLQEDEKLPAPAEIQEISLPEEDADSYEDTYGDDSFDDEKFDLRPKKKKFGPFSLPGGKTGNLVIAGIFTSLLLILGSVYFVIQTYIPDELANIQKTESEIPEGLTPRESPEEPFDIEEESGPDKKEVAPQTAALDKNDLEPVRKRKSDLAEEFAKSKILKKSEGVTQIETSRDQPNEILLAALGPADTLVTLNAILPVAYDANDIKILSFVLELEVTDKNTARLMREALPIYEDIMLATVEKFLSKNFYNDVFYVKEKLQKQFMADFNKSLESGRVKKTRFREFLIQ